ncbi:MAG: sodium:dicarboxylate symporter [Deltaproteobacteria bacterium RIFOXYA12_FULL_61_11]|nr:MAG: sodium:dicarboxylate symporter [Deltaproteobacteria bacterium RIFOXYA12_FULL_61_11]
MSLNPAHRLTLFIFLGIVCGILTGGFLGEVPAVVAVVGYCADLFLRLLRMLIVPLIVTSIITGVAGVGSAETIGRLGLKTLVLYILTSLIAILTGLGLVNLLQPGVGADLGLRRDVSFLDRPTSSVWDLLGRMIPDNVFQSLSEASILPVIFFCILFGVFLANLKNERQREALLTVFQAAYAVMMRMTAFVMLLAPLGAWGIVARIVANTGFAAFLPLGLYALCVFSGLVIHASVSLPLMVRLLGRSRPWRLAVAQSPALLTAFSTASSSATLPLTLECIERRAGLSPRISGFVLPLGATVNMDGTALYECVAALFIAQAYGINLSLGQQVVVVFTALLASIGAAGIPMAGLVMMSVVLTAVGLPLEGVGLILAVDHVLDMCRTTVNVWSDCCVATTVASLEGQRSPVLALGCEAPTPLVD